MMSFTITDKWVGKPLKNENFQEFRSKISSKESLWINCKEKYVKQAYKAGQSTAGQK